MYFYQYSGVYTFLIKLMRFVRDLSVVGGRGRVESGVCGRGDDDLLQLERGVVGAVVGNVDTVVGQVLDGRLHHAHAVQDPLDVHGVVAAGHLQQQVVERRGRRHGVAHQRHDEAALAGDVHDAGDVGAEVVNETGRPGDGHRRRFALAVVVHLEHVARRRDHVADGRRQFAGRVRQPEAPLAQGEALDLSVHVLHGVELTGVVVAVRRSHHEHVVLAEQYVRGVRGVRVGGVHPLFGGDVGGAAPVQLAPHAAEQQHQQREGHHGAPRENARLHYVHVAGPDGRAELQRLLADDGLRVDQRHLVRLQHRRNVQNGHGVRRTDVVTHGLSERREKSGVEQTNVGGR